MEKVRSLTDNVVEPDVCTICLEHVDPKHVLSMTTPCGHVFHRSCLRHWSVIKNTCPVCVADLPRPRVRPSLRSRRVCCCARARDCMLFHCADTCWCISRTFPVVLAMCVCFYTVVYAGKFLRWILASSARCPAAPLVNVTATGCTGSNSTIAWEPSPVEFRDVFAGIFCLVICGLLLVLCRLLCGCCCDHH